MSLSGLRKKLANRYVMISAAVLSGVLGFLVGPEIRTMTEATIYNPAPVTAQVEERDYKNFETGSLETMLAGMRIGVPEACAFETGDFKAPEYNEETNEVTYNGDVYKFNKDKVLDKDGDGIGESPSFRFKHSDKRWIIQFTKDGKTWGWAIFGNQPDKDDLINNYTIVDTDGKDGFDRKYLRNEGFSLPEYLRT